MLSCKKCGNSGRFVQFQNGHQRTVVFDFKAGGLTATKGAWKKATSKVDGIFCAKDNTRISAPVSILRGFRLDDPPPQQRKPIDPKKLLKEALKAVPKAEVILPDKPILRFAPHPAHFGKLPASILAKVPCDLQNAVQNGFGVSLDSLYSHQVEAITAAISAKNVVIQTGTASGKSLCYVLPVLSDLLQDNDATAFFVFPTKALGFDQLKKITDLDNRFDDTSLQAHRFTFPVRIGPKELVLGKYERETKDEFQRDVKEKARIVFTNPDSLHFKILPHMNTKTGSWDDFFRNLRFVVLDEIHTYRGVFGANVAYLIRRLRLMCKQFGANPQFICASATLPQPQQHAEMLVGSPFVCVDQDGAPQAGKLFGLWNPGFTKGKGSERREPTTDAIDLLTKVILEPDQPVQTITFARSLRAVENFNTLLKRRLKALRSVQAENTATYKSTITSRERNEIQTGLITGRIVHVTATTALELGIDIGDLECCLMLGYPGSVSSTLQQAGRAGRNRPSLALMLLRDEPLEQWFGRDRDAFFTSLDKPEMVRLPLSNPLKLQEHIACACWEQQNRGGLIEQDAIKFFGVEAKGALQKLAKEDVLDGIRANVGQACWRIRANVGNSKDKLYRNIRIPIATGKFVVLDEKGGLAGECDSHLVSRDLYPGAIWINNGRFYRSKSIDYKAQSVSVQYLPEEADYYTYPMPRTTLTPRGDAKQRQTASEILKIRTGIVEVSREVKLYSEVPFSGGRDKQEVKTTYTHDMVYDSTATWWEFGSGYVGAGAVTEQILARIHGIEHALRTVFPLVADVDPNDVGSTVASSKDGVIRLYLFDNFAGGTGLAEFAFNNPAELVMAAQRMLSSCKCANGCPLCLIVPWCESKNENLDKRGAVKMLKQVERDLK